MAEDGAGPINLLSKTRFAHPVETGIVELEGDAPDTSIAPIKEIFHVD